MNTNINILSENRIPHPLWRVTFDFLRSLSGEEAEKIAAALEDCAVAVALQNREATDGDDWTLSLTTYGTPDLETILDRIKLVAAAENLSGIIGQNGLHAEKLPEKDWLLHVHENFPPVTIGGFFIYGSHYTGEKPATGIPLQIDAATAFGSGEHETTKACLLALESLKKAGKVFKNGLDMGCGSGILAIAMKKLWPEMQVTAVDIDPESIIVSQRHAEMNALGGTISLMSGDGYKTVLAQENAPYDLVTANILANPLIAMAAELNSVMMPHAYAILSGLLTRQKTEVQAAHEKQGLQLRDSFSLGEWQALLLQK